MRIVKSLLVLALCTTLSACGPLYGQFMKTSEGLKNFEVTKGDITDLRGVKNLLVVGPFLGAGDEHHMCIPKEDCIFPYNAEIDFVTKYNDAQRFANGFRKAELFETELYLEVYYDKLEETTNRLKSMNSQEIQKELELSNPPEMIFFGTVKKRENKIAPARGVVVDVHYELEFYNPETKQSILIDVAVFKLFKEDLKTILQEMKYRLIEKN